MDSAVGLCGLQDGEHGGCTTEMKQAAAVGGNALVMAGAEAEKDEEGGVPMPVKLW